MTSSSARFLHVLLALGLGLGLGSSLNLGLGQRASAQSLEEEQALDDSQDSVATDASPEDDASGTSTAQPVTTSSVELRDDQAAYEERTGGREALGPDETDPRELADTDYFFLGAFARGVVVPTFMQGLFVQYSGGRGASGDPVNMGAGAQFTWRRNGFNVTIEAGYLGFGTAGYYRGLDAADTEYEFIESNLGMVFGSFLFGWSIDVTDWFAFEIGLGLGFGGVVGDLYRTEAYRDSATNTLAPCTGPGSPASGDFCEPSLELRSASSGRLDGNRQRGGTYQRYRTGDPTQDSRNGATPFYFGDGGVPPIFFSMDLPRIGLRFKPIHQLQIRVDGGYNLYGFNFGGSLAFGF